MKGRNKVYPYVVVLKQKNRRSVELVGLIASFIFLIIMGQRFTTGKDLLLNALITLAFTGMLIQNILRFRKGQKTDLTPLFWIAAFSLSLVPPRSYMALFFFILAILYRSATRPQEIGFSSEEIVFDGIFPKKVNWAELTNVLIKDGILTMDYKNNKLFQKETDELEEEDDDEVTEEEFNAYCREHISAKTQ
jgi:hypothetical protein